MTIRTNRNDPWHGPGSAFEPNTGPADNSDQFAMPDTSGLGLRPFLERETALRASMYESSSCETLGKGVFLRKQANGFELLVDRGRNTWDVYSDENREKL